MPYHIRAEAVPERVLLTGDPDRAERLANGFLDNVKLINRNRGFLVFSGTYRGTPIAIAAHGIGGPSMAIVAEELRMIGMRVAVRLGTAAATSGGLKVGDVIVAAGSSTVNKGGLGAYFGLISPPSFPSPRLTVSLYEALKRQGLNASIGPVLSSDAFYAEDRQLGDFLRGRGFVGVEMECATLMALSWLRGFESACVLVVSNIVGEHSQPDDDTINRAITSAAHGILEVLSTYQPIT